MMSTAYGIGAVAVCGECGELISLARVPAAEVELWIHTGSGLPFCYREPQHTQTAWPDPNPNPTGGADPVVLGFVVQCGICPQQAVVLTQPKPGWVCPRCAEVAGGFGDVDVAQAEPAAAVRLDLTNGRYPNVMAQAGLDDDDYPLGKVRG